MLKGKSKKLSLKPLKTGIVVIALLLLLASCAGEISLLPAPEDEGYELVKSDEIKLSMRMVRSLNPLCSADRDSFFISKLIYDSLFVLGDDYAAVPSLVESYEYSPDGYSLSLVLKKGIRWQDGEALSAQDVKFSIDCLKSFSYENTGIYKEYVSGISSVTADWQDSLKLTVYFNNKYDAALEKLIFPILPKHQFTSSYQMKTMGNDFIPVGTGRYRVESYNYIKELRLVPSESYRGEKAQNTLVFSIVPGNEEAVNLLNVNEIGMIYTESPARKTLVSASGTRGYDFVSPELELIAFNLRQPELNDKRIRQAICYAFDAKEAISAAFSSSAVPADSMYLPSFFEDGSSAEGEGSSFYEKDMEYAETLLKLAGVYERGDAFTPLEILVRKNDNSELAAANLLKNALDQLALPCTVYEAEDEEYYYRMSYRSFEIAFCSFRTSSFCDYRQQLNSYSWNYAGYQSPQVDSAMDLLMSGASTEEKKEALKRAKDILKDDVPYYPYLFKTYGLLINDSIKGESEANFMDIYKGIDDWYTEEKIFTE